MEPMAWLEKYGLLALGMTYICVPVLLLAGCGRGEVRVPTYAAAGRLLAADERPVAHALVVLHPLDANSKAPRPRATTDADGNFQLTTYETGDGAPEGEFIVTIEQWLREDPAEAPRNQLPTPLSRPDSSTIRVAITKSTNELEPIRLR